MKIRKLSRITAFAAVGALALTACGSSDDAGDEATASTSDNVFTIAYNGDGGHQAWVDATTNSIKNTLGINAEGQNYATFAELRSDVTERKMTGAFRTGWQADYPSLYNFLGPIYGTGAGSNDGDYSNADFDSLLSQGQAAATLEDANVIFDQAQEVLFQDLPAIPLWYSNVTGGSSENVADVAFGWNSVPLYYAVTKADGTPVLVNGSEPANPLVPTNTNETGGGKITDLIFAGLVSYEADGTPVNELAESIETTDNQLYTIKIKGGTTFTNGEPVTAASFVDAWKYGGLLSNAQLSSYFFEGIEGFSYDEESELTGLNVVDDTTFTVQLQQPEADFPLRLGYTAFMPLPAAAFTDMAAFGENPIGNGPYMVTPGSWEHNVSIDLEPNPSYSGVRKPANAGVTITFYDNQDSAYNDLLANNLDVLDAVPDSAFGTYEDDLGTRAVNQPSAVFQSFTMAQNLEHFEGEEGNLRRQAISMAIDRQSITDTIFQGTRTPAKDFTSPTIAGWNETLAGSEVLEFNPEKAKELWAEANAINEW
ncbi:ABC transporter substrate-binding protein [Sanguibacter antarcticus]|uniref:Oligopeptide transport system substrate-binding protein n=1 Tax=Sanguibacter antarcticus TaxID=372484 RepID=A0A2A9E485_9MICO|nr:ABC transporter substrate-binding protein [Sanguibacter antarcticus]PFG33768.1 oligopeptide transport system substrate-binding protein [Sanguibacter antarcticus]